MRRLLSTLLGMLLISAQLLAQNRTIAGKIIDDKGAPISNASVSIKGTQNGTVTDNNGAFTLTVPANAKTLVVSSVGLGQKEITLTPSNSYTVTMSATAGSMEEVVVVGYQTRRKKDEAGSISSVRGAEIENKPNITVDKALQGRAAGVLVQANNGIPGGAINIRIRGVGSFLAGTQPLFIVDGVQLNRRDDASFTQTNPLGFLNPNDIESIDVLKDAATAAIYGSQASNGVVVITTKKGRAGKTKFNFNTYFGQSSPIKMFDVLNTQEWAQLRIEAYANSNPTASMLAVKQTVLGEMRVPNPNTYSEKQADSIIAAFATYDWQEAAFRKGSIQNYEISASGGNDRTTFRISSSYTKQQAIVTKADYTRGTLKLDMNNKATDKFNIGTSINLSTANQNIPFSTDGSFLGSPAFSAAGILPFNPIYNSDGSYYGIPPSSLSGTLNQNIIAVNDYNSGYQRTNQAIGSINLTYNFTSSLYFRSFFGLDYRLVQGKSYRDPRTPDAFNRRGLGQVQSNWNTNFITTQTLNYNESFNKSKIDALVGFEYKREDNEGISTSADNFPSYQFTTLNAAANNLSAGEFFSGFRREGVFGSATYNYDGKYIGTATLRYDGSSRFGANHRFGLFPSIKAAWNIDEEDFLKDRNTISQLRFRASWGETGNDQIGNFDALGLFGSGSLYNGAAGINYTQLANPELRWERNQSTNLGVDFGLFSNRITSSVDVYRKFTKDLLLSENVSQVTGFSSITSNLGSIVNKGIELQLGGDVLRPKSAGGLKWNTNFVFTFNKNKVNSLYRGLQELPGDPSTRVGKSLGSIFTYRYAGVNSATGRPMWYDSLGNITYQVQSRDRVYIGDNQPEYWGGWSNNFNYKGFSLEIFFNYEYGRMAQDGQVLFGTENIARINALKLIYDQRWNVPGQITSYPRMGTSASEPKGTTAQTGDRTWFRADYIRLKTVTLSYDLPASIYKRLGLTSTHFYIQGTNLWTYQDTESYDVEFFNASTGIIPQSKMFTVGVQLGF